MTAPARILILPPGPYSASAARVFVKDAMGRKIGMALSPHLPDDEARELAEATALLFAASYDLIFSLRELLGEIDNEIDQRKHSGNAEDWGPLAAKSATAHAAIAKAEGRA